MFDDRIFRDLETGLTVDLGDAPSSDSIDVGEAVEAMSEFERGERKNESEQVEVGHYWLRDSSLAPTPEIRSSIETVLESIRTLKRGERDHVLLVGIGGSALGVQLIHDAIRGVREDIAVSFLDNTDPDGFVRVLEPIEPSRTWAVIVSKSGGTIETLNGLEVVKKHWQGRARFEDHAIAITMPGSQLHDAAADWKHRFPIWGWVGGRTSLCSAAGLVPMQLAGRDIDAFLAGARACDVLTRRAPRDGNPAAALAAVWYAATRGRGERSLVIEPYRDRLRLLPAYLQQLVMESLGKRADRQGHVVEQGIVVYGNKGATDQHSLMQQLRDGLDNALVHFIETEQPGPAPLGRDGIPVSDYLVSALWGTRSALADRNRPSVTICIRDVSEFSLGVLIALFERTVGIYAELININAYDQPGVEAGKRAGRANLHLLEHLESALKAKPGRAGDFARRLESDPALVWRLLGHLAQTGRAHREPGPLPALDVFRAPAARPAHAHAERLAEEEIGPELLREHLFQHLLPIWRDHGLEHDGRGCLLHLNPDLTTARDGYRRLVVQARQLYVFSHAAIEGAPSWALDTAARLYEGLRERYRDQAHGGWWYLTRSNGAPLDRRKDTYAASFVLLALAYYWRASGDHDALALARTTLAELDQYLLDRRPNGFNGYLEGASETWQAERGTRRQDPHLHLLEAFLALQELTGDSSFGERANDIVELFESRFFNEQHGCIHEFLGDDWSVKSRTGSRLEPGHHFEWVWLLHRYAKLDGSPDILGRARRLFDFAVRYGLHPRTGAVLNCIHVNGRIVDGGQRVWPQTEHIKAVAALGSTSELREVLRFHMTTRVDPITGGWHEGLAWDGTVCERRYFASSVYHIVLALIEAIRRLENR